MTASGVFALMELGPEQEPETNGSLDSAWKLLHCPTFHRPTTKLREDNVFRGVSIHGEGVCLVPGSFWGGGGYAWYTPWKVHHQY